MPRRKDITGLKFGRLTVIKCVGQRNNPRKEYIWLCQCSCGNKKETLVNYLVSGHTKSCGCWYKEAPLHTFGIRPYGAVFNRLVRIAKERRFKNTMSFNQFLTFTKFTKCHYCFSEVSFSKHVGGKKSYAYNLDRKDNTIGYSKENCVVCCPRCNGGKSNLFSYEEWLKMTKCFREEKNARA